MKRRTRAQVARAQRGQKFVGSERLNDREHHDGDQQDRRYLVDDPIEFSGIPVFVRGK
jgi:hypothetical protein